MTIPVGILRVMSFKTHFLSLGVPEREELAAKAGTTRGTLNQVAYAGKRLELGLGMCLAKLCGLPIEAIPLTDRARQQHQMLIAKPRKTKEAAHG